MENIEHNLITKNITPTAMRLLVLDFLLRQDNALSLSDIETGLAPADRITIYRTLKKFEEHGLVHAIDDGSGKPKYALCAEGCETSQHQDLHVHFHCNKCNETTCLPDSSLPDIALPAGFQPNEMNLIVKGICDRCGEVIVV